MCSISDYRFVVYEVVPRGPEVRGRLVTCEILSKCRETTYWETGKRKSAWCGKNSPSKLPGRCVTNGVKQTKIGRRIAVMIVHCLFPSFQKANKTSTHLAREIPRCQYRPISPCPGLIKSAFLKFGHLGMCPRNAFPLY